MGACCATAKQTESSNRTGARSFSVLEEHVSGNVSALLDEADRTDSQGPGGNQESLKWLNWALQELWPNANNAIVDLIKKAIEPALQEAVPGPLKRLHFSTFHLGQNPPVLGPIAVAKKTKQRHPGLEFIIGINWVCDANIELTVPKVMSMGIKRLIFSGELSLVLRPIMNTLPIVGGFQLYMTCPPNIDWKFSGDAKITDFPLISGCIRNIVHEVISSLLVLPNRIFIHWVWGRENEIDLTAMQYPRPEGLLRLGVVEGRNLEGKDFNMFGKATSDPFATTRIGARSHQTPYKRGTLTPNWGDEGWADFFIFSNRQAVSVEVIDKDLMPGCSDFIGRLMKKKDGRLCHVSIKDIIEDRDNWWPIFGQSDGDEEKQTGEVRILSQEFLFKPDAELLKNPPQGQGVASNVALLTVQIHCLRGLPREKATGAKIQLTLGDMTIQSIAAYYEEPFQDLTYDWNAQAIDPASQRLAELLYREYKCPMDKIAEHSGLRKESLESVLKQKPSFTTKWHQGLNVLVAKTDMALHIKLLLPVEDEEAPPIELEAPFQIKDMRTMKHMKFDEHLFLKRKVVVGKQAKQAAKKTEFVEGPFELDIGLQLWGLWNGLD